MITITLNDYDQIIYSDLKNEKHIHDVIESMINSHKLNGKSIPLTLGGKDFNTKDIKDVKID